MADDDDVDKVISYLQSHNYIPTSIESPNVLDKLWLDTCNKLTNIRLQLSTEDEEIINSRADKLSELALNIWTKPGTSELYEQYLETRNRVWVST